MSIRNIDQIRYLKRENLTQEAKILAGYYRDIIHHRGIDCVYFKQDTEFPDTITPSLSAYENLIYGENNSLSYSTSANMIIFMEVEQDIFSVDPQGTMPDQHYIASFMIDEYSAKFAYLLGGQDEFKTQLTMSAVVDGFNSSAYSDFSIEGLSGLITCADDFSSLSSETEFITNGDFDSSTGWVMDSGWSIGGGLAQKSGSLANQIIKQDIGSLPENRYHVGFKITSHNGGGDGYVRYGNWSSDPIGSDGIYYFNPTLSGGSGDNQYIKIDSGETKTTKFNVDWISLSGATTSYTITGFCAPSASNLDPSDYEREVVINPYIKQSPSYTIPDDDYFTTFIGRYTAQLDQAGNGTYSADVSGALLYASLDSVSRYGEKVRPEVGDIIRIDFPDDVNFEDYKITSVHDRNLTDGGINPLLHKYIYRCDMVRRIPNDEEIFGDYDDMEPFAKDLLDVTEKVQHAREVISNEVDDYSDGADDIYGGYGTDATEVPDVEEYTTGDEIDVLVTLFEFGSSGSNIYTNGWDLYFRNSLGDITKLTVFHIDESGTDIPTELMYLKTDGVDLYFFNKNKELAKLTNNTGSRTTSVPLETLLVDFNSDNVAGDMVYKFKSAKTTIFTDGVNLFTQNDAGTTTQLTSN